MLESEFGVVAREAKGIPGMEAITGVVTDSDTEFIKGEY